MTDYKSGTVAVATVRGVPGVRVVRRSGRWISVDPSTVEHPFHDDTEATDVRPLVVLDLNDGGDFWSDGVSTVRSLLRNLRNPGEHTKFTDLANAIEQQTRQPKPAEPTGLGAVVEDADGAQWVLVPDGSHPWVKAHRDPAAYTHRSAYGAIDAVKVLSDGVQP